MPLTIPCPKCAKPLKARDEHVGRKAKCQYCQHVFVISAPAKASSTEPEITRGGSTVYRHQAAPKDEFQLPVTYAESCEQISAHVEQYIGPIESVLHEIISETIHLDVLWVKPTPERNWHTYITSGMSDLPMTTPAEAHDYRYAELVICLPPTWGDVQQEPNYWPIFWLKSLARLPHTYNTWLHTAHTIPNGDPPEPMAPGTQYCGWLLIPPLLVDEGFRELQVEPLKTIHFFGLTPLYPQEMDYKLEQGFDALVERWEKKGIEINELLNLKRANACKKGFFG